MYHNIHTEQELGFDAFIAPDDFDHANATQYGGDHPVDIYEIFKREYLLNSQSRYIYYYSDGNYPLTLTPTATEYYRYGYTTGGTEIIVDVPLNDSPITVFAETTTTKRWVVVCRPNTYKFNVFMDAISVNVIWIYAGIYVNSIGYYTTGYQNTTQYKLKYIHYANINSLTLLNQYQFFNNNSLLNGRLTIPESVSVIPYAALYTLGSCKKVSMPNTKVIGNNSSGYVLGISKSVEEFNIGASTDLDSYGLRESYASLSVVSVSEQNTTYSSMPDCDIIFNKSQTAIEWIAPKSVRGIYLPDTLPQAQMSLFGTKWQTNLMKNYSLYIGSLITDITNLYLSTKSFVAVGCWEHSTAAFTVDNNILYNKNKTKLIKSATNANGSLIILNTVQEIDEYAFKDCTNYTGSLVIGSGLTSIAAYAFSGLTGLSGDLVINSPLISSDKFAFKPITGLTGGLYLPQGFDLDVVNDFSNQNWSNIPSLIASILNCTPGNASNIKKIVFNKSVVESIRSYQPGFIENTLATYFIDINSIPILPKLLWDISSISGSIWNDKSGNNNNGQFVSNYTVYSDNVLLSGTNSYVYQNSGSLGINNKDFTLHIRAKLNLANNNAFVILGRQYYITKGAGLIIPGNKLLSARVSATNTSAPVANSNIMIADGLYHDMTVVYTIGRYIKLYIDGVLVSSLPVSYFILEANVNYLDVNCYRNSQGTPAASTSINVKNVIVYDRELKSWEVESLSLI